MNKSILIILHFILFISSECFTQDYITELPKEKNQLFCILNVKVETILQENFKTTDTTKIWKKIIKNYYDPSGYLVKKEIFDSSSAIPSLVNEYKYDEKDNYTEFLIDGKLREQRIYNDLGKITHCYYYNHGDLSKTQFINYDSYGNEIEIYNQYSTGKIDTILVTVYNYDYAFSPPRIISDTTYFRELDDLEITISEFDSIGRCTKSLTFYPDSIYNHTTLFFYNDKNLFDSTIQYTNQGVEKYIRYYDDNYRLTKTINYSDTDSIKYIWILSYNEKIFITIDSLFQNNDLDLTKISDFEKTGVILETLHKDENEIRTKIVTEYYPNGLIKNVTRYDYKFEKMEKKYYEYEFY